jgi:hypothetical protein
LQSGPISKIGSDEGEARQPTQNLGKALGDVKDDELFASRKEGPGNDRTDVPGAASNEDRHRARIQA